MWSFTAGGLELPLSQAGHSEQPPPLKGTHPSPRTQPGGRPGPAHLAVLKIPGTKAADTAPALAQETEKGQLWALQEPGLATTSDWTVLTPGEQVTGPTKCTPLGKDGSRSAWEKLSGIPKPRRCASDPGLSS
ncbi:uncharacterized protein LOC125115274 isoform X3 [Phacochoerus africanus]|uniref:uncharacterized protein LOC125115274 isoform X3 n=1 Tax=Phacochoerus africanus TaxID=41426 RepID=UPI001FD98837|nr:uncharacterized protein LOC125115274 isoform X3 [Phacochoerus africanus]